MIAYRAAILLALILSLVGSGCDPGYFYRIVEPDGRTWSQSTQTVKNVRFTAESFSVMWGSCGTGMNMTILNRSDDEVVVLGGQLTTDGQVVEGRILGDDRVRPGAKGSLSLNCDFDGSAYEVLAPEVIWSWQVRIGVDEHTIQVQMKRE